MSGPRVTSGDASRQDYATPAELMAACARRFGPIVVDLAATAENAKHERYYAPARLTRLVSLAELEVPDCAPLAMAMRATLALASARLPPGDRLVEIKKPGKGEFVCTRALVERDNVDPKALALDALAQPLGAWAAHSAAHRWTDREGSEGPGVAWLNCEWADVDPWASRCREEAGEEAGEGMNGLLLVPAQVGSLWFDRHVAGHADVFFLQGRVPFNGEPFPKDCMVCHYYPGAGKIICVWDWRRDQVRAVWGAGGVRDGRSGDLGMVWYERGLPSDRPRCYLQGA